MQQNELTHHGIKGMRWGVRRYQNKDGSLTEAGKKRQNDTEARERKKLSRKLNNYGPAQNRVVDKYNSDRLRDKEFSDKWSAAFNAGKGSKEWSAYEKYADDFINKYKDEYIDAWLADNRIKRISEKGRQYVTENLWTTH